MTEPMTGTPSKSDLKALWRIARFDDLAFMVYLRLTMTREQRARFYDACRSLFGDQRKSPPTPSGLRDTG